MRRFPTPLAPLAALLAACGSSGFATPRVYEASAYCDVVRAEPLFETSATPFGATVAELFAPAVGEHRATLGLEGGGTAALTVRVTPADSPAYLVEQASDWVHDVGGCGTDVQRLATISYETDDGLLAESFDTVLHVGEGGLVRSREDREPAELHGTLQLPGELTGGAGPVFTFESTFGPGVPGGSIGARATFSGSGAIEGRVARIATFTFEPAGG